MDRLLTGGDSGEHTAREMLLRALGPGWKVEQVIDREEGDTLTIEAPSGFSFYVKAPRLWLSCSIAGRAPDDDLGPAFEVTAYGGTHRWTVEPVPWWQRPRWLWRLRR